MVVGWNLRVARVGTDAPADGGDPGRETRREEARLVASCNVRHAQGALVNHPLVDKITTPPVRLEHLALQRAVLGVYGEGQELVESDRVAGIDDVCRLLDVEQVLAAQEFPRGGSFAPMLLGC